MIKGIKNLLEYQRTHPKVSQLTVGEKGWMVAWCFKMTKNGDLYMQDTEIEPHGGGTLTVLVTRTEEGYDVDFSKTIDHGLDVVEDESNLNDYIMGNPEWISIGNVKCTLQN